LYIFADMTRQLLNLILFIALVSVMILTAACRPQIEKCGSGNYYCNGITSIYPFSSPAEQLSSLGKQVTLLSDGRVISRPSDRKDSTTVYNLTQICQVDTICFVSFYSSYWYEDPHFEAVVVTPHKCCVLWDFKAVISEFASSGPDSTRLLDATAACLDNNDNLYVIDTEDATVKVYDIFGRFVGHFTAGINPKCIRIKGIYVYVLDGFNETINQYNSDWQPTGKSMSSSFLEDIVSFDICGGFFIVADHGGNRVSAVTLVGELFETKTEYCYQGINFQIGRIVSINSSATSFSAVDLGKNLIIHFSDAIWDSRIPRY
jgi:hypothetical protein